MDQDALAVYGRGLMDDSLTPRTVWRLLEEGRVQLIDLRGHVAPGVPRIPGARPISFDELPSELVTLDRTRPVVFVSDSGREAVEATQALRSAGLSASAVEGGMFAWLAARLPTERAGEPPAG